jgi:hypothetical protein
MLGGCPNPDCDANDAVVLARTPTGRLVHWTLLKTGAQHQLPHDCFALVQVGSGRQDRQAHRTRIRHSQISLS